MRGAISACFIMAASMQRGCAFLGTFNHVRSRITTSSSSWVHRKMSTTMPSADSKVAESGTVVDYGGIPHVAVLVGDAQEAQQYYTHVLGMSPDVEGSSCLAKDGVPGACVRVGAQTIYLLELPNPDPLDVDPSYSMSAPPKGYVANGRPVHAGRDRHVAITLHDLAPLKASLEANNANYTMSYSGRQALFTRDKYGNGWEFGPPLTYEKATRLFPPYLAPDAPEQGNGQPFLGWGGMPHVGLLVSSTSAAEEFYCGVLGMVDENDLRPEKLPFPGLFLRCGEQQVHILELPNPDPDTAAARPGHGRDRRTAFSVKSLAPLEAALEAAGVPYAKATVRGGLSSALGGGGATYETTDEARNCLYCYDPDANELVFIEDTDIQVIKEDMINNSPMLPWTRLW